MIVLQSLLLAFFEYLLEIVIVLPSEDTLILLNEILLFDLIVLSLFLYFLSFLQIIFDLLSLFYKLLLVLFLPLIPLFLLVSDLLWCKPRI